MDIRFRPPGILTWPRGGHRRVSPRQRYAGNDGATPEGCFALRRVLYRPDRVGAPRTALPVAPIDRRDGWCDDPADPRYNRPVRVPCDASHEVLWRTDGLYDLLVVLGYNDDPPRPALGSAVCLHVADPGGAPTEGCVAIGRQALRDLLGDCGPADRLCVSAR